MWTSLLDVKDILKKLLLIQKKNNKIHKILKNTFWRFMSIMYIYMLKISSKFYWNQLMQKQDIETCKNNVIEYFLSEILITSYFFSNFYKIN